MIALLSFKCKMVINSFCFSKNSKLRKMLFEKAELDGIENIPIFIISFNRLSYLQKQIFSFEKHGFKNIIIIDNGSSYPALLDYYKTIPYLVIFNGSNDGHMVFWKNEKYKKYRENFYIITDPDIELLDECPNDVIHVFFDMLKQYRFVNKVGFSLKIDDVPEDSIFGDDVYKWEKTFYNIYDKTRSFYYAPIDTTFALYLPDCLQNKKKFFSAIRMGYPYQAKHLPWYRRKGDITAEDLFYSSTKENGWWDPFQEKMIPDRK